MGFQSVDLTAGFPERFDCLSASKMKKFVDDSSNPEAMNLLNPEHKDNKCKMKSGALSFGVLEKNSDVEKHKSEWCKYQPTKCGVVAAITDIVKEDEPEQQQQQQAQQPAKDNSGVAFLSSSSSSVCCMFMLIMIMARRR